MAPGGCEGINLNKKINFYKNSFLVIFGVKFHATALACTPTDAQKRGASFKKKIDAVASNLTPKMFKKLFFRTPQPTKQQIVRSFNHLKTTLRWFLVVGRSVGRSDGRSVSRSDGRFPCPSKDLIRTL